MATVIARDHNRYEVVQVINPDDQVLNVAFASGAPATNPPSVATDAFGRLRVSEPFTLFDSSHRYGDNGLWDILTATGGSSAFDSDEGCIQLTVTNASGSSVTRETKRVFAYQPGKSLLVLNTFALAPIQAGLTQRLGYYNDDNGIYVQLEDDILSFVRRSSTSGSLINTVVNRTNWNIDQLDGTGPSGITIDLTKVQIFWLDMEWLGAGNVRLGFVYNGQFVHCHTFQHANVSPTTYLTTACLPLRYEIFNTALTSTGSTLRQICSTILSEGGYQLRGQLRSIFTPVTAPVGLGTAGNTECTFSIRLKSSPNRLDAIVVLSVLSILATTNGANYRASVVVGGTTTGGTWVSAGVDSPVEYNITGTSHAGGRVALTEYFVGSSQGTQPVQLTKDDLFQFQLQRNGLTGTPTEFSILVTADTNNAAVLTALGWDEVAY
jgi:hypothetical protein